MGKHANPKIRNAANADLICERVVDGLNLREIAKELGCNAGSIAHWIAEDPDLAQRYGRAKDAMVEVMAAEIADIADDGSNDWMIRNIGDDVVVVADHEHIQRSKLRVDTRKWLLSKMAPKRYGDRVAIAGDADAPLVVALTVEQRQAKAREIIDAAFGAEDGKPENGT